MLNAETEQVNDEVEWGNVLEAHVAPEDRLDDEEDDEAITDNEDDEDEPALGDRTTTKAKNGRAKFEGPYMSKLYETPELIQVPRENTERGYRAIWNRWKLYCLHIKRPGDPWVQKFGLGLFADRTDVHNVNNYDHRLVDGFFSYLIKNEPDAGMGVMRAAKTFLNFNLSLEHYNRLKEAGEYPQIVLMKVGTSVSIQRSINSVATSVSTKAMANCEDIQADLEQTISPAQVRQMTLQVFEPIPGGKVSRLSPINRLIFANGYHTQKATTRRGEELYNQRLVQRSTQFIREIGPFGTPLSLLITNHAKHNQYGWLEYTGSLPHMDPLCCAAAMHGVLLCYRVQVLNEVFPSFVDGDFKAIFDIMTLPSAANNETSVEKTQYSKNYVAFYSDNKIYIFKVTHEPRISSIQWMDRAGISEPIQMRSSGHKGNGVTVHTKSYSNIPPTPALVHLAGGDANDLKGYHPVHFMPTPEEHCYIREIVKALIPDFVDQYVTLKERYHNTTSHKQRKAMRLTTLKGCLGAMISDVELAVMMLACPQVDPYNYTLLSDRRSVLRQYQDKALAALLHKPCFNSNAFSLLEASILKKMEARETFLSSLDAPTENKLDRYVRERIARPVFAFHQQQMTVMRHLQELQRQQQDWIDSRGRLDNRALLVGDNGTPSVCTDHEEEGDDCSQQSGSPGEQDSTMVQGQPGSSLSPQSLGSRLDGSPRKRRKAETQEEAISREITRKRLAGEAVSLEVQLRDDTCKTLRDFWDLYKRKWKPLELSTNGAWRKDFGVGEDGKKKRQRSQWWSHRSGMYTYIEYQMDNGKSEEEALVLAEAIFGSVGDGSKKGNKRPPLKKVGAAFKKENLQLGIGLKGRPKKDRSKATTNPRAEARANTNSGTAASRNSSGLIGGSQLRTSGAVRNGSHIRRQYRSSGGGYGRRRGDNSDGAAFAAAFPAGNLGQEHYERVQQEKEAWYRENARQMAEAERQRVEKRQELIKHNTKCRHEYTYRHVAAWNTPPPPTDPRMHMSILGPHWRPMPGAPDRRIPDGFEIAQLPPEVPPAANDPSVFLSNVPSP